ncbi:MAG TPA: hypothetical protein VFB33_00615 [Candidatus Binataceae bacterium]|jgi:hypothetical protein|nr:hypothetical protein [Candidatus Binataceae bacterium]
MAKYTLVVLSNPTTGKEAEFNEWYDKMHVPDVLRVPGFVAAQRFKLAGPQLNDAPRPHRYLALYEIETDDIQASIDALRQRAGTTEMLISDAIDIQGVFAAMFTPVAERVLATDVRRAA